MKSAVWYSAWMSGSGTPLSVFTTVYSPGADETVTYVMGPPGGENLVFWTELDPSRDIQYMVGISCGHWGAPETATCVLDKDVPLQIRGMAVTLKEDISPIITSFMGNVA